MNVNFHSERRSILQLHHCTQQARPGVEDDSCENATPLSSQRNIRIVIQESGNVDRKLSVVVTFVHLGSQLETMYPSVQTTAEAQSAHTSAAVLADEVSFSEHKE